MPRCTALFVVTKKISVLNDCTFDALTRDRMKEPEVEMREFMAVVRDYGEQNRSEPLERLASHGNFPDLSVKHPAPSATPVAALPTTYREVKVG
jgi:hypothetical protein